MGVSFSGGEGLFLVGITVYFCIVVVVIDIMMLIETYCYHYCVLTLFI